MTRNQISQNKQDLGFLLFSPAYHISNFKSHLNIVHTVSDVLGPDPIIFLFHVCKNSAFRKNTCYFCIPSAAGCKQLQKLHIVSYKKILTKSRCYFFLQMTYIGSNTFVRMYAFVYDKQWARRRGSVMIRLAKFHSLHILVPLRRWKMAHIFRRNHYSGFIFVWWFERLSRPSWRHCNELHIRAMAKLTNLTKKPIHQTNIT